MKPQKFHYEINDITISMVDIAHCMGYEDGIIPEPYHEMAQEIIEKVKPYCDIRGGYILKDNITLDLEKDILQVEGITFSVNRIVSRQIRNSEQIAFFVCTAGEGISRWSKELMNAGDLVLGYVVDTLGTVIVEVAMDKTQKKLNEEMSQKGLNTTNRYSPGYCGWNVSEQHKLFKMFPENFCNISLSDTALMHPIKSVSGIIGIGEKVRFNEYTCNFCDKKDCVHRNKRFHSG